MRNSTSQVGSRTWKRLAANGTTLSTSSMALTWSPGGRLVEKDFENPEPISYTYDKFGRIERVIDGAPTANVNFERYLRDAAGNPTQMLQRVSSGTVWTWTYAPTTSYNQIPSRSRSATVSEAFGYDAMSRLITWSTSGSSPAARTFTYDGGGRLRRVVKTGTGATTERYHYDVDDQVPWEERVVGATTTHVWRHEGWEKRGTSWASGVVTEEVLPMAALRGTTLLVRLQELDGHAYQMWNSTTGAVTQEVLGAFAQRTSTSRARTAG